MYIRGPYGPEELSYQRMSHKNLDLLSKRFYNVKYNLVSSLEQTL